MQFDEYPAARSAPHANIQDHSYSLSGLWSLDEWFAQEDSLMKKLVVLALVGILAGTSTKADIISELGAGIKVPVSTSYVMLPVCEKVQVVVPPDSPRPPPQMYSCGGNNPAFIGWPIAYQREFLDGRLVFRGGWFHYSNWFDKRETHMDIVATTVTINWSEIRRSIR